MNTKSRLTALEQRSGVDEPPRVVILRLPETLTAEAWTLAAREHASGKTVSIPMREIIYIRGRRVDQ